ncbi:cation-transporting P-type ATPase, partial [Rhizobium pusense]|nr:cation-transporting P-type ATPase [Agrobacterium pusense]
VGAAELVPGDVVFVDEGARVPADGILTEAHELSVDESLLSGESVAVAKAAAPPGTRPDLADGANPDTMLFFGSMVVQGQGRMVVTATAHNTTLGRIGKSLTGIAEAPSPLQVETGAFVRRFALIAIALCLLLIVAYRWRYGEWISGVLGA